MDAGGLRSGRGRATISRLLRTGLAFISLAIVATAFAGTAGAGSEVAQGRRLYRDGIGTDGAPVHAVSQGDVPMRGAQAACVNCHRPSGLGSSEGGYYVPPVSGPLLFAPRKLDRRRLFPDFFHQIQPRRFKTRLHQPHMRPAYTLSTLATVLEEGVDPAGQRLARIMPHYRLSKADVAALYAYLRTLSAHVDPGVNQQEIRFATVFSDNVPAPERAAMLSVLRMYVHFHNLRLHEDRSRHRFSPYNRSEFVPIERAWKLTVWELKGPARTWRAQLEAQYRKHPVFALVGGKVDGSWAGPSRFCDENRIPCLFPDTELPAWPPPKDGYTVYFDAGLPLEARAIARFIASKSGAAAGSDVVQLTAADEYGRVPAAVFRHAMADHAGPGGLREFTFHSRATLERRLREVARDPKAVLVIWPGRDVRPTLAALAAVDPRVRRIFLPARAIPAVGKPVEPALARRMRFAEPYELNPSSHVKSFETRAWMRTRGLDLSHPRIMFEEYYAMSLLEAALFEISNDFYRDYLLERVEDESQKDLNPGIYPALALGPGERFASKGVYIVALTGRGEPRLVAKSGWITP